MLETCSVVVVVTVVALVVLSSFETEGSRKESQILEDSVLIDSRISPILGLSIYSRVNPSSTRHHRLPEKYASAVVVSRRGEPCHGNGPQVHIILC